MRYGYTANYAELATKAICRVSGGPYSHCFPIFYNEEHRPMYFESISKVDPHTHKTGVRGPYPLSNVVEWQAELPSHRRFTMQPLSGFLPLTTNEVGRAWKLLGASVHDIRYAPLQIIQNWLTQRTGLRISYKQGSIARWTCSETCVRILPARLWFWFDQLNVNADDIVPSGNKLMSVWAGTEAMLTE